MGRRHRMETASLRERPFGNDAPPALRWINSASPTLGKLQVGLVHVFQLSETIWEMLYC